MPDIFYIVTSKKTWFTMHRGITAWSSWWIIAPGHYYLINQNNWWYFLQILCYGERHKWQNTVRMLLILNDESDGPNTSVILDGTGLSCVKTAKFLGLSIDENFTWKYHIHNITKTISCNIGVMNKIKQFVPERILCSLFCSSILPYINYGIRVWRSTYKTYIDKILKLQKWALRTISNSHYRAHIDPLFVKYNVLNVYDINLELVYLCISIQKAHFLMVSTTSLLPGLKYMIITLDTKIIIITQEMLEHFHITQSELMGQYFGIHWITSLESQIR